MVHDTPENEFSNRQMLIRTFGALNTALDAHDEIGRLLEELADYCERKLTYRDWTQSRL